MAQALKIYSNDTETPSFANATLSIGNATEAVINHNRANRPSPTPSSDADSALIELGHRLKRQVEIIAACAEESKAAHARFMSMRPPVPEVLFGQEDDPSILGRRAGALAYVETDGRTYYSHADLDWLSRLIETPTEPKIACRERAKQLAAAIKGFQAELQDASAAASYEGDDDPVFLAAMRAVDDIVETILPLRATTPEGLRIKLYALEAATGERNYIATGGPFVDAADLQELSHLELARNLDSVLPSLEEALGSLPPTPPVAGGDAALRPVAVRFHTADAELTAAIQAHVKADEQDTRADLGDAFHRILDAERTLLGANGDLHIALAQMFVAVGYMKTTVTDALPSSAARRHADATAHASNALATINAIMGKPFPVLTEWYGGGDFVERDPTPTLNFRNTCPLARAAHRLVQLEGMVAASPIGSQGRLAIINESSALKRRAEGEQALSIKGALVHLGLATTALHGDYYGSDVEMRKNDDECVDVALTQIRKAFNTIAHYCGHVDDFPAILIDGMYLSDEPDQQDAANAAWAEMLAYCADIRGIHTKIDAARAAQNTAEADRLYNELEDMSRDAILDRLQSLPKTSNSLAALMMHEASSDLHTSEPISGGQGMSVAFLGLEGLLPHLSGVIAETARHLLTNRDAPGCQSPLWT